MQRVRLPTLRECIASVPCATPDACSRRQRASCAHAGMDALFAHLSQWNQAGWGPEGRAAPGQTLQSHGARGAGHAAWGLQGCVGGVGERGCGWVSCEGRAAGGEAAGAAQLGTGGTGPPPHPTHACSAHQRAGTCSTTPAHLNLPGSCPPCRSRPRRCPRRPRPPARNRRQPCQPPPPARRPQGDPCS